MRKSDKKPSLEKLAALSETDRRRLYKQAARKRKAAMNLNRNKRDDFTRKYHQDELGEFQGEFQKRSRRGPVSLEDWVLKLLAETEFDRDQANMDAVLETFPAAVVALRANHCQVIHDSQELTCLLRPELTIAQRSDLAVGDQVNFSRTKDGTLMIEEVLPRKTVLSRPDPHDIRVERVIAANVETALIVSSVHSPPMNTNMIDRYLLAVERGGVEPLICVNKIDLIETDQSHMDLLACQMQPYHDLGINVILCSAQTGSNIDDLIERLSHKLAVVVGHSGVGKSSILNCIDPSLNIFTRTTRKGNRKGRHSTVKSNLYHLPHDITVIDTPGVRSFGIWDMEPHELRWYFVEFDEYTDNCKFSNCTHTHEPDCAVKEAVEVGKIKSVRYESYCRLLESLHEEGK